MSKTLEAIPEVHFTGDDIMGGHMATMEAEIATTQGPIFKWTLQNGPEAGETMVFMVGPEANRFVFHTHRDHFSHDLGWTPVIGENFGRGLLNMDDPDHARHRKMWNPAFTSACMEAYLPLIERVIAERSRTWPERDKVDIYQEAREITFDAAAAALAGFRRGPDIDRIRELFYLLLHGFDPEQETWDSYYEKMGRAQAELTETLLQLIAERRRAPAADTRDVLGVIVHARDENGQALSDEQVLAHLNILLVAGHETTTTLGAWVLYLFATQPEHLRRIRAELDTLPTNPDGTLSVSAVRGMKQLDYFIREAGRLYSPVLHVPRGVVKDFEFAGYHVPAGTQVRLALAAGHRLPHVFANPETFDPARFAPPREEDRQVPYSLVTFGGGSRICIGINFAQIEVKALAAHVLRTYDLAPASTEITPHAGFWTAELQSGIWLHVTKRQGV